MDLRLQQELLTTGIYWLEQSKMWCVDGRTRLTIKLSVGLGGTVMDYPWNMK